MDDEASFQEGDDGYRAKFKLMIVQARRIYCPEFVKVFYSRNTYSDQVITCASFRFRCLHSCMMQRPQTVTKIVLAACVLCNLLAEKNPVRMQGVQPGEWRR